MEIPLQFPSNIYSWISIAALIVSGALYVRGRDIKAIRENAEDLRKILEDKIKEMTGLQSEMKIMGDKIELLEKRNRTLEDLVITALKQFFFENPKIATGIQDKIMK